MLRGRALAFIPVQRPLRTRQDNNDFLFVQVMVISAHRSGRGRSEVHVGDASQEIEGLWWRRKAEAAPVAVIVEFGDLDFHVDELSIMAGTLRLRE